MPGWTTSYYKTWSRERIDRECDDLEHVLSVAISRLVNPTLRVSEPTVNYTRILL